MTTKREPVDMSPRAIAQRLDEVGALYRLTLYLRQFGDTRAEPVKTSKSR